MPQGRSIKNPTTWKKDDVQLFRQTSWRYLYTIHIHEKLIESIFQRIKRNMIWSFLQKFMVIRVHATQADRATRESWQNWRVLGLHGIFGWLAGITWLLKGLEGFLLHVFYRFKSVQTRKMMIRIESNLDSTRHTHRSVVLKCQYLSQTESLVVWVIVGELNLRPYNGYSACLRLHVSVPLSLKQVLVVT